MVYVREWRMLCRMNVLFFLKQILPRTQRIDDELGISLTT